MLRKPPCMRPGCAVARGSITIRPARRWLASISSATSLKPTLHRLFHRGGQRSPALLDVLRHLAARTFRFNAEAFDLLHALGVAQRVLVQVQQVQEQTLSEARSLALLEQQTPPLGPLQRQHVLEAAAAAVYHAQLEFPVIQLLVCDDAPQFNWLTAELALCWVHEGRHYKKLAPCVPHHQELLTDFQSQFWSFMPTC